MPDDNDNVTPIPDVIPVPPVNPVIPVPVVNPVDPIPAPSTTTPSSEPSTFDEDGAVSAIVVLALLVGLYLFGGGIVIVLWQLNIIDIQVDLHSLANFNFNFNFFQQNSSSNQTFSAQDSAQDSAPNNDHVLIDLEGGFEQNSGLNYSDDLLEVFQ